MDEQVRLRAVLTQLNDALGGVTSYKLDVVPPGSIKPVKKNAHYMSKRTFDQLVANVSQDQNLSSLPFCWRTPGGEYVVLSGNHRVMAAKAAEVPLILILYTDQVMSESEQVAVQLSHNAIVGADNPAVLRELWQGIGDLHLKIYTGLDDAVLQTFEPAQVIQVSEARLRFEELTLLFLPAEIEQLKEIAERLGKYHKGPVWAADVVDFDAFFDMLLDFKEQANILNTSTAFKALVLIAQEWLDAQAGKDGDAESES